MKKLNRLISLITIFLLTCGVSFTQTITKPKAQSSAPQQAVTSTASSNPVTGSGTVGRIAKWTGVDGANSFTLGNTNIFEDKFGKVGIGTTTPTSPLTVRGMIETTLGGYKFPDGTVQTTAGLASVFHNATLVGNGTQASPLGVAIPLTLTGATPVTFSILNIKNTGFSGNGLTALGGERGTGVQAAGGDSPMGGGIGVEAFGGGGGPDRGGIGVLGQGGSSNGTFPAGSGVLSQGGINFGSGPSGHGVEAQGGTSDSNLPGAGVKATGGNSLGNKGAAGVLATGGPSTVSIGGAGVEATGGNGKQGGDGIVATGGNTTSVSAGVGVRAVGGIHTHSDGTQSGEDGIIAIGSEGRGAGRFAGDALSARAGQGSDGATPGRAGVFTGDVEITGALNVSGTKNFKIDHPLDPANKYLYHAAIESSEILNVYSGNVKTNKKGEAIVTLPDWFEALNKDFRYQLTPIGSPAQGLYIAEKVNQNRFKIAGAKPHMEISWQVTGIRSDAAMRQLTFKVEEEKPVHERGTYLSPEAYREPKEKGIKWARNPERMDETQPTRAKQTEVSKPKAQGRDR
jgi:hypothetical protein